MIENSFFVSQNIVYKSLFPPLLFLKRNQGFDNILLQLWYFIYIYQVFGKLSLDRGYLIILEGTSVSEMFGF